MRKLVVLSVLSALLFASAPALASSNASLAVATKAQQEKKMVIKGKITEVSGTTLTVKDKNGASYKVDAGKKGIILKGKKAQGVQLKDMRVNDEITVRGTSDGDTIKADSIKKKKTNSIWQ